MKYILRMHLLGQYPEVELDDNAYEAIKRARKTLSDGLDMEENYEILISNYLEFEREILEHAAQAMIRRPYGYDDFFQVRMSLNRRLVNLLTAARLYVDQLHRHVRGASHDDKTAKEEVDRLFSGEYDNSLEYRFMEALRNYVQHHRIPVHWVEFNVHADDSRGDRLIIYSVELASQKDLLQEDDAFKKSVLEEIPEKVDLKMAARVYVEGISRVHAAVRKSVEGPLSEARSTIEDAIASYRHVFPQEGPGLRAICLDGYRIVETVPLLLDWDDIRIELCKRNPELVNLRDRYVSGQVKPRDK